MKYFERVVENVSFKFLPLVSIKDASLLGYKLIKDYSIMGQDKEYMYSMAFEEKIFDMFALKIFEKACKEIINKNLEKACFFYTLRFNFLNSPNDFFKKIQEIIDKYQLRNQNFVFDIKGIEDWDLFYRDFSYIFNYKIILKEERDSTFSLTLLEKSKASFMEPRTVDTLAFIKGNSNPSQLLIFNLAYDENLSLEFLKTLGVDYYYNSCLNS